MTDGDTPSVGVGLKPTQNIQKRRKMYTTIQEVRKSLKGIDSAIIPDTGEDEFSVEFSIEKADRIINAHLSETFTIPESPPDLITEISVELSASFCLEFLYSEENGGYFETAHRKYKRAMELLTGISKGTVESGLEKKSGWGELWVC